jgi:hypothetical protein
MILPASLQTHSVSMKVVEIAKYFRPSGIKPNEKTKQITTIDILLTV